MFAEWGFADVSMRQLAGQLGLSVASIYHHFPNKNDLYLKTVQFAFAGKAKVFEGVWQQQKSIEAKLEDFIRVLIDVLDDDPDFHRLIQRELLEANDERMDMLAKKVFSSQFSHLLNAAKAVAPNQDAQLMAVSILALCKHHFEMRPLSSRLPGWQPCNQDKDVLAQHITDLLFQGIKDDGK